MQIGLAGLSLTYPRPAPASGAATIAAPFTRVNGPSDDAYTAAIPGAFNGWSVNETGAIADDTAFTCVRQGYDTSGNSTTYLDTMYVTKKIRQPVPNDASLSTSTYALNEYIWSTDTPSGSVTNNSDLKSPVPIVKWITPGKYTVGNSIGGSTYPVELVALHYHARSYQEVACVKFRITDGTTTITVTVSAPTLSPNAYDGTDVTCWALPTTDITSLASGLITVHADVYPWIGDADSVASSEDATLGWQFASLYYRKDVTLAASPPIAWVNASTGDNGTGVISTTAATAEANKFLTIKGAIDAADTSLGGGTTGIDNLLIYLDDGTHAFTAPAASRRQKISRITITRSTSSTNAASVLVTSGSAVQAANLGTGGSLDTGMAQRRGAIHFKDVTLQRSGAQTFIGGNSTYPLEVHLENIRWDRNTQTNHSFNGSAVYVYSNGVTFVSSGNNGFFAETTAVHAIIRGHGAGHTGNVESQCVVGNSTTNNGLMQTGGTRYNNRLVAYNIFGSRSTTWDFPNADVSGVGNSYNVYEFTSATQNHSFLISNDSAAYSNDHVVCHHNTYVGWNTRGRENIHYDEGPNARKSTRMSYIGNIHVGVFHKGDRFRYTNEGDTAAGSTRLGNWAFYYGVGCRANFNQFSPVGGQIGVYAEAVGYPGRETPYGNVGTSGVVWSNDTDQYKRLDPLFVDNKGCKSQFEATGAGSTSTASAGAGGGDYRLQSSSPAKSKVANPIRPYTLDGVAVGVTDHMGAMSAQ